MNYLFLISHRILFFGKIWTIGIFILEAGNHLKKYKFRSPARKRQPYRETTNNTRITCTNVYAITSQLLIPSPLLSFLKLGMALNYPSPGTAPVHPCLNLHKTGEELFLQKAQGPTMTIPSKPRRSNALSKTFSPIRVWKAKGRRGRLVINDRWLSVADLHKRKSVSFPSLGAWKPETPGRWSGLPRGTHSDSAPSDLLINSIYTDSAGKYDGL